MTKTGHFIGYETDKEMAERHEKEIYGLKKRCDQEMKDIHVRHQRETAELVTVRMTAVTKQNEGTQAKEVE